MGSAENPSADGSTDKCKRQKQDVRAHHRVPSDECASGRCSEIAERSAAQVAEDDGAAGLEFVLSPLTEGGRHEGHDRLLPVPRIWNKSRRVNMSACRFRRVFSSRMPVRSHALRPDAAMAATSKKTST